MRQAAFGWPSPRLGISDSIAHPFAQCAKWWGSQPYVATLLEYPFSLRRSYPKTEAAVECPPDSGFRGQAVGWQS